MNDQIYHLRHTQMDERLALMLSPIINAYRPHDEPPTRDMMEESVANSYVSMRSICKQVGVNYRPQNMA